MSRMIVMDPDTKKNVTLVLTWGIDAWLKEQADIRSEREGKRVSNAVIAREVFENAMRESEAKSGKAA